MLKKGDLSNAFNVYWLGAYQRHSYDLDHVVGKLIDFRPGPQFEACVFRLKFPRRRQSHDLQTFRVAQ